MSKKWKHNNPLPEGKTVQMPRSLFETFIATLEAPDNQDKQGRVFLYANGKYCCLGVQQYCAIGAVEHGKSFPSVGYLYESSTLYYDIFGSPDDTPYFPSIDATASQCNDAFGMTFFQIAQLFKLHTHIVEG